MILNKALKWAEKVLAPCGPLKRKVPDLEIARPGDEVPLAIAIRRWIWLLGRVYGPTHDVALDWQVVWAKSGAHKARRATPSGRRAYFQVASWLADESGGAGRLPVSTRKSCFLRADFRES